MNTAAIGAALKRRDPRRSHPLQPARRKTAAMGRRACDSTAIFAPRPRPPYSSERHRASAAAALLRAAPRERHPCTPPRSSDAALLPAWFAAVDLYVRATSVLRAASLPPQSSSPRAPPSQLEVWKQRGIRERSAVQPWARDADVGEERKPARETQADAQRAGEGGEHRPRWRGSQSQYLAAGWPEWTTAAVAVASSTTSAHPPPPPYARLAVATAPVELWQRRRRELMQRPAVGEHGCHRRGAQARGPAKGGGECNGR